MERSGIREIRAYASGCRSVDKPTKNPRNAYRSKCLDRFGRWIGGLFGLLVVGFEVSEQALKGFLIRIVIFPI